MAVNKDQASGIFERLIYSGVLFVAMQAVARGWITADMAPYIATGAVAAAGSAYAWWHNRPVAVINRAGDAVPEGTKIVMVTPPTASQAVKDEVHALNAATNNTVSAQVG